MHNKPLGNSTSLYSGRIRAAALLRPPSLITEISKKLCINHLIAHLHFLRSTHGISNKPK